jgi:organic radical activating enzyme
MPTEPHHFTSVGWVIVALAAMAVAWNQIDDWVKRRAGNDAQRVGPQPFVVQPAAEFVPRLEFDRHVEKNTERHGQLFDAIDSVRDSAGEKLKAETAELHDKINAVATNVAALTATSEIQNQQLAGIQASLNRVLERMPRRSHDT